MTKQGLKAIEEIQVGDQVLAYNDNLKSLNIKMLSKYIIMKQQNYIIFILKSKNCMYSKS